MTLKGRAAVVTGAARGLGAAIARRLAAEGARVLLSDVLEKEGGAQARRIGRGARFQRADITNPQACRSLIAAAVKAFGRLDILVNNAAVSQRATIETFTPGLFDLQFHTIVRGPLLLAQAALPHLRKRSGVIVNIGSVNAYVGHSDLLCYAAAKGALMTASKNLANALQRTRVRVHLLNPGWMDTEGERQMMTSLGNRRDHVDREGRKLPLGRLVQPEEVADVCAFLCSDAAAAFSGTVIDLEQYPVGTLYDPTKPAP